MADIRLAIAVDSAGAIKSVKTFNDEVEKVPASAKKADGAVGGLRKVFEDFQSGLSFGAGFAVAQKGFAMLVAGATAVAESFGKMMNLLLGYSDKMVTVNQRTGVATSSLQVLAYQAKMGGTDFETLAKNVVKMEVALGKGDGAFQKLGLSLSQLKAMSPDAAFAKVAQSIGAIEDPMQRASAAVAIFGKAGADMLPLFAENMEAARQKAEEFGLVLSEDTLRSAESLGDAIDTAGMAFDAFLMRLAGIVAQSPALMEAIEQISTAIGGLSKSIDGNQSALTKWIDYGLDLAADAIWTLLWAVEKAIATVGMFGGTLGAIVKGGADYSGLTGLIDKMKQFTEQTRDAMRARAEWARIDMGGKGVLLPGGTLPKQGGGGPTFNGATAKAASSGPSWESFFNKLEQGAWKAGQDIMKGLEAGNKAAMPFLERDILSMIPKSLAVPTDAAGKPKVYSFDNSRTGADAAVQKSSFNTAQALQNLANIASVSGSKLGKAIAGIAGGGAGLAGGLGALKDAKGATGFAGLLGKVGAYGQIASSVLSIGSSIFGLFKKKPKEPPPEPPKKATAESWRNFVGDQQSKGAAGILAGVSGIGVSSVADMGSQASIALQSYWQVWKEKGPMAAAEAFKPIRDKMLETFKAAGASDADISAMLGPMSTQIDLAGNKAFAGAAEGMNGFADALASVANQQMPMTVDQFRAYEQQALNGFNQMKQAALDQGLSMEEATRTAAMASGKYLTTLKDASSKYRIDLGGSEALFDEAAKAGVMLGSSSEERLIMSLDALTEALGGAPPKFEQAMTAGANRAGDRISEGAATGGVGAGATATDIGSAIAAKLGGNFDKLSAAFSNAMNRPIEITTQVNLDGTTIANGLADTMDRRGGERLRTALEGA